MSGFLKLYAAGLACFLALDLVWLGLVARGFYQRQLGHLMRADVQWVPAILFYLIFVAALVFFVVEPALERQSLARAAVTGALFGLAAYAAFDLTGMALLRDFPLAVAVADLAWGSALSAAVASVSYLAGRG